MSKVKFFIKAKKTPSTLYVRFSVMRGVVFRKSTQLQIDPKFFNSKSGKLRNIDKYKGGAKLKETMQKLSGHIIACYNDANIKDEMINSLWFDGAINSFFNRVGNNNIEFLESYAYHYVEKLPTKTNRNGTIGCTRVTIVKYTTILRKITAYEKARKKKFRITDVDISFRDDFLKFLIDELGLGENTAGRYIKFVKTICLDAKNNGIRVSPQLESVRGFIKKTDKIILKFDEIDKIENTPFDDLKLNIARDWLIIGCYIGQRLSDLLEITSKNIVEKNGHRMIELTQMKTKKKVSILIHPKVEKILKKYGGEFPPRFRESVHSNKLIFNVKIKEVARLSGLTEEVFGGKMNKETRRKVWANYPKYQLVSSHIMRRSFASNFYGDVPTALLISVTGHSTEKMFLEYIGKSNIDYAEQLASYWNT